PTPKPAAVADALTASCTPTRCPTTRWTDTRALKTSTGCSQTAPTTPDSAVCPSPVSVSTTARCVQQRQEESTCTGRPLSHCSSCCRFRLFLSGGTSLSW